jgi:hypothetical protein
MNYLKRLIEFKKSNIKEYLGVYEKRRKLGQTNFKKYANNAIWFFGCSHVWGVGVEDKENCGYILEKQLGIKVLNLGINGAGPMTVADEIDSLLNKRLTPKGIIIAWPSSIRWQHYTAFGSRVLWLPTRLDNIFYHNNHFGCKMLYPKAHKEYLRLLADESIIKVNKRVIDNVRDKIKDIPSIEFTFNSNEVLDINQLTPILDKGKDNLHPGPLTHKKVADILTELVKEWK